MDSSSSALRKTALRSKPGQSKTAPQLLSPNTHGTRLLISTPARHSLINWLAQERRLDLTQLEQLGRQPAYSHCVFALLPQILPVRPHRRKRLQVAAMFNHPLCLNGLWTRTPETLKARVKAYEPWTLLLCVYSFSTCVVGHTPLFPTISQYVHAVSVYLMLVNFLLVTFPFCVSPLHIRTCFE